MTQCVGEKWTEKAQSNTRWRAKLEEMICWIKKIGGLKLCRNGVTWILVMMWDRFQLSFDCIMNNVVLSHRPWKMLRSVGCRYLIL